MTGARIVPILLLLAATASLAATARAQATKPRARPAQTTIVDASQRIDINNISMVVSNHGWFAYDEFTGSAGLEFPKGSFKTAVYASGLWLGAIGDGSVRVTVAEYSSDYRPGAAPGGVPDDPNLPRHKVYKLNRLYPDGSGGIDVAARDAALADYNAGAVPSGAPVVPVQGDGALGILGDQMLWSVYNDLGKGPAHNRAGSVLPLGIEVQQTTWAYDRAMPTGYAVFTRFKLVNRGALNLTDMHVGFWADADLGGFNDDLAGCDTTLGLGFCYNATNNDQMYGTKPPAVGFKMLQGPYSTALAARLPLTAFFVYPNGSDPQDSLSTFRFMHGLDKFGNPILDPGSQPTRYMFSGDPVTAQGWLDPTPSDRRFLLASGPFTMAPGDMQEVVLAILLARASDRLSSLSLLEAQVPIVQAAFDADTLDLLDVPGAPAAALSLAPPWPNPAHGAISLSISLPSEGEATVELVDVAGRRVFRQSLGHLAPGPHAIPLQAFREPRAAGIYFVRLTHHGTSVAQRLVHLP